MKADVIKTWQDANCAYIAIGVQEGDRDENNRLITTEYIGTVILAELDDDTDLLDTLIKAAKAVRSSHR